MYLLCYIFSHFIVHFDYIIRYLSGKIVYGEFVSKQCMPASMQEVDNNDHDMFAVSFIFNASWMLFGTIFLFSTPGLRTWYALLNPACFHSAETRNYPGNNYLRRRV